MSRELARIQTPVPVMERARSELRRLASRTELVAYAVIGLALLGALLFGSWGWLTQDTRPELYLAPARALRLTLATWRPDPYLGQPNFDAGTAPMALAVWAIRSLGVPAWVAVRLWRWLLLVVAGAGAALLYHSVTEQDQGPEARRAPLGRVVAALVYAANPYAVVGGATAPVLWPYALLPCMLLALAKAVRQPRSWTGPAAFALAVFAAGGTNAGVVPLFMLLAVPCYLAWVRLAQRLPWRDLARPALRCLGLALLVSLYWLVPALSARESAAAIAFNSQKPLDVAAVSSYAETLRGLGLWLTYGRSGDRLFTPAFAGYVTNPLIMLASFAFPVAAAVAALRSRSRARALAAILLAVAVPVMVGLFPTTGPPTPFARLLTRAFDRVPGAIAFRTTNKAGALAALAIALLIALGAAASIEALRRRAPLTRLLAPLLAVGVLVAGTLPLWSGGYAAQGSHLPAYWQQAAADLNASGAASRVLFLPGEVQSDYRWGLQVPDDLNVSLLSRPSVLRSTAPNGSDLQSNFLAALDVPLASGVPSGGVVSAMARYLGASEVLVRNDLAWERSGGVQPSLLAKGLAADPNLRLERSYGRPGENTLAPGISGQTALPPLQRYAVTSGSPAIVRAEPVEGALLVDGDSFALPSLASLGLLAKQPTFRLLGSMSPDEAAIALDDGAHIVLSDTIRRRIWDLHHTIAAWSPTLPGDQSLDGSSTLSLFGDSSAQTVARLEGASSVSATSSGTVFGLVPWGKATSAFDGDPRTAWLTGNFGAAVGQSITLRLDHPVKRAHLPLHPVLGGPVQIASVRIHLDGGAIDAPVPAQSQVTVKFPATTTQSVTVEITGTRGGPGLNPVGFWEIGVPGVQVTEVARLPERIRQIASGLDAGGRGRLAATPLDVVLARAAGDPSSASDDEERALNRQFWLPDARSFTVTGQAQAGADLPEPLVDQLAGASPSIVATSSSRLFDSIDVRASAALDGNPDTAWIPGGDHNGEGEWIDLRVPDQTVNHVTVVQSIPKSLTGARVATEAQLSLNGGKPIPVHLREGSVTIPVPRQPIRQLRLTLTKVAGLGSQVRVSEVQVGNAHLPTVNDAGTTLHGCVQLATVDGAPLKVSLKGTLQQLAKGTSLPVTACNGQRLSLGPGEHQLRSGSGWLVNLLDLASPGIPGNGAVGAGGTGAATGSAIPRLTVTSSNATRSTISSEAANGPWYLVLGQGYDSRWRATMDGQPLGPPVVLDGYSVGWRITSTGPHQITVAFGPQRQADLALYASLAGLALVVLLLAAGRLRRPGPGAGSRGIPEPLGTPRPSRHGPALDPEPEPEPQRDDPALPSGPSPGSGGESP